MVFYKKGPHVPRSLDLNRFESEELLRLKSAFLAAVREELEDPQTAANLEFLLQSLTPQEIGKLALFLQEGRGKGPSYVMEQFARMHKEKIEKGLEVGKKTVAFYYPTPAYRDQLGTLPARLRSKGFNVLTFFGNINKNAMNEESYYGGLFGTLELMKFMDFIDIHICPVLATDLPPQGVKIYFLHDIHDTPLGDESTEREIARLLRNFDYVFMPSIDVIHLFSRLVDSGKTEGFSDGKKPICFIPGGYIKLDRFIQYFEKNKREEKTLVYAPTVTGYGFDEFASVLSHGENIVQTALTRFPDFSLIFRPHPHSLNTKPVRGIVDRFGSHPRFIFDHSNSYLAQYSRAALMITDISGTAFTYALATLRPVVFFSFHEEELQKCYGHLQYLRDRAVIGKIVRGVDEMEGTIRWLLENRKGFCGRIREYRESKIFNVGQAEDYFLDHFPYIVQEKRHPQWIYHPT